MKKTVTALTLFIVCLAVCLAGRDVRCDTADVQALFDSANEAYWKGNYTQAAEHYERLKDLGIDSTGLYYNLGTACARAGELGRAALYLEKSLRRDPGFSEARFNLNQVRGALAKKLNRAGWDADLTPHLTPWRAVVERFNTTSASIVVLVFSTLLWIMLLVRYRSRREMPRLIFSVLAVVFFILFLTSAGVLAGVERLRCMQTEGIVVSHGAVPVSEGPGDGYKKTFRVMEGERVQVLASDSGWHKIRDDRGREGWIQPSSIGVI